MILGIFFVITGLSFGSFASVLVTRIPQGRRITGRSMCPQCQNPLQPVDLIPVVSFMVNRGRCRVCRVPISMLYPLMELSSGAVFLLAYVLNRDIASSAFLAITLWLLLVISVIDYRTKTISDALNIPLCIFSIFYAYEIGALYYSGAAVGGGFFALLWLVSRGRWIGSGDIVLGTGIGFLIGRWDMMLVNLILTYSIGALMLSGLLLMKKVHRKSAVPFAPFLAVGALVTVVFYDRLSLLLSVYFSL